MARQCELSGKKTVAGRSRRHQRGSSGGVSGAWSKKAQATPRTFRPNLIRGVRVVKEGKVVRMDLAAKALKRIKKFGSYKGVTLAN